MKKKGMATNDSPDRLNVIVEGSKVIGDLMTESNLRIDGEVKGNVASSAKVVIGVNGRINGNLTCMDADIEGKIEGTLKIDNLLSLRNTANVNGEITTAKLQIEEGAEFSGNCKMNNNSNNYSSGTLTSETQVQEEKEAQDIVY